jgi:AcrR family transcriptional regulator
MLLTPWGDADSLRERRLHPGPGTSPEEVSRNQRERFYGATVAAVSTLGYEATRVADLVEISGVSSRSFYDLFPGKEACFVATLREVLNALAAVVTEASARGADWDDRVGNAFAALAELVVAQPATARFILNEAYAAGPSAWGPLDEAMSAFEDLARLRQSESRERGVLPEELIVAQIGAIQEVIRTRLRTDSTEELVTLLPQLLSFLSMYRPPPEPLRLATRAPTFGPETAEAHDDAERALRGFALAVAEKGYAGATIHQIARRGGMSPTTFYANFHDKEDVLLAAIDSAMAQLTTAAVTAFGRSTDWPSGVRAGVGSLLNYLASRPAMARLLTVEVFAGGAEAVGRREQGTRRLRTLLAEGRALSPDLPPVAVEAVIGGTFALARRCILDNGTEALPALAPVCTYFALAPFLGPEEACRAANGDGRGRRRGDPIPGALVPMESTKWAVMTLLARDPASAESLAGELNAPVEEVHRHLADLKAAGLAEATSPAASGPVEWQVNRSLRFIDREDWAALSLEERDALTAKIYEENATDVAEATAAGTVNRRLDNHTSRLRVSLDEQGWEEIAEIHRNVLNLTQAIHVASLKRLRKTGEKPVYGASHQSFFEMPHGDLKPLPIEGEDQ